MSWAGVNCGPNRHRARNRPGWLHFVEEGAGSGVSRRRLRDEGVAAGSVRMAVGGGRHLCRVPASPKGGGRGCARRSMAGEGMPQDY